MIADKSARIRVEVTEGGCSFTKRDPEGAPIVFERWGDADLDVGFSCLAVLGGLVQSGLANLSEDQLVVEVRAKVISTLEDDACAALEIPPVVPFLLEISAQGALGSQKLETRWVGTNGLRLRDVSQAGCFIRTGNSYFRLASPFYQILERIEAFNSRASSTPAEQARDWSEIQELVGFEPSQIKPSKFLSRMRVARADRFTLDFVPGEDGAFQVAPVPLVAGARSKPTLEVEGERNEPAASAEPSRLLSAQEQHRFQSAFRARSQVQGQYLAGDDVYVLLSPEVERCLRVVRRVQDRPPAERIAFARNPFAVFREAEPEVEPPFAETRSFSDRVTGLGILEKVTLPWQILGGQGWLPPRMLQIDLGNSILEITPKDLESAIVNVELALANGEASVLVGDVKLPALPDLRETLLSARAELDQRANSEATPTPELQRSVDPGSRVGMQLARNLEASEYTARNTERRRVPLELPETATVLKEHQEQAVRWLQARWASGRRGALLADDMGLGKTLSALSFMIWLRSAMQQGSLPKRPMLIVAPVSLLQNWQAEHERHIGSSPHAFIDIKKAYGSGLVRRGDGRDIDVGSAMLDMEQLTLDRFGAPTCVLTTYETLRDYQQSFASVHFGLVVLDEAQRIKNPASLGWHAVSALNADFWLALTGTPVENRLADLWAIADAVEPGLLGNLREFSRRYEKDLDQEALRELKRSLEHAEDGAPFMLRRLKEHVLSGIPAKIDHVHQLPMPPVQESAYNEIVASAHDQVAPKQMLAIVQQLRETSLHPLKPMDCPTPVYLASSARFQSLLNILDEIRDKDEKALIFLDRNLIESYLALVLKERYNLQRLPAIINGTVPGARRQQLVDEFQNRRGFDIMILSPKAGGVGLTLTAANHVIHLSRWWNPAVEDQSTDRVYRIGQRKDVHVHYLQATLKSAPGDSFDERLHLLLQKKRALSRDLLWPFESEATDAASLLGRI